MAYEVAIFWSGLCSIVAIYFLWTFRTKRNARTSRQKPARDVILEATTKRLLDSNTKDGLSENGHSVEAKPIIEMKKEGKDKSELKDEPCRENMQSQLSLINRKTTKEDSKVYRVKIRNEGFSSIGLDPDALLPVTRPLKTMDEVDQWIPGFDYFNIATVPLRMTKRESSSKPKTLVCHDMKGGYTEDRFVQGYNSTLCYRINDWNFIDIFVYFSHNIVTIPPPCWTNSCHRHGVKVLGTFITEWDEGEKICSQILETRGSYERFAKKLVEIACYYNFDGWLVNIENRISPDKVNDLISFLGFLTESMHKVKSSSEIIWYDSVTIEGELKWQNELNAKNSAFFDVCDGIFLNYTWSVHNLSRSSLIAGNQRKFDVYVGVDCFGRGCLGGGGWNTYKAMQVIREQNLSAAIFAPGWVLETQGEEHFTKNQARFFQLLMQYLYPHIAKGLPLVSSFSQGYGNHYFSYGKSLIDIPWTNLSCQQFQPTFKDEYYKIGSKHGIDISAMFYSTDDAFEGGGCLKVNGKLDCSAYDSRIFLRLFLCESKLPSEFLVSYTIKLDNTELAEVYLLLLLNGEPKYILLSPIEIDKNHESKSDDEQHLIRAGDIFVHPSCEDPSKRYVPASQIENYVVIHPLFGESKSHMDQLCHNGKGQSNGWITRYYLVAKKDLPALREVRLVLTPRTTGQKLISQFSLLLGEVQVMAMKDLLPCFPLITNICCRDTNIQHIGDYFILSTTIIWDKMIKSSAKDSLIMHYDIFSNVTNIDGFVKQDHGVFLGKAYVESFRLSQLKVEQHRRSVEVYIRPVSECNVKAPRKDWGNVLIEW